MWKKKAEINPFLVLLTSVQAVPPALIVFGSVLQTRQTKKKKEAKQPEKQQINASR